MTTTNHQPTRPRVRRWDQPQPPDTYPERPQPHPGVRQSEATHHHFDWEFTNGLPVTRPVVHPDTPSPTQMITTSTISGDPDPFAAPTDAATRPRRPVVTYWAAALGLLAEATVSVAIWTGDADPIRAVATLTATSVCSVLLIAAEQIWCRTR